MYICILPARDRRKVVEGEDRPKALRHHAQRHRAPSAAISGAESISGAEAISGALAVSGALAISGGEAISGAEAISGTEAISGGEAISSALAVLVVVLSGDSAKAVPQRSFKTFSVVVPRGAQVKS